MGETLSPGTRLVPLSHSATSADTDTVIVGDHAQIGSWMPPASGPGPTGVQLTHDTRSVNDPSAILVGTPEIEAAAPAVAGAAGSGLVAADAPALLIEEASARRVASGPSDDLGGVVPKTRLTVVMPELGNLLGFQHDQADANAGTYEEIERGVRVLLDAGAHDNASAPVNESMWLRLAIQGAERQDWSRTVKPTDAVPAFVRDAGGGGSRSGIDGNERSRDGWGTRLSLFGSALLDSTSDFSAFLAKTIGSNGDEFDDDNDGATSDKSVKVDKGVTFDNMGRTLNSGKYTKADKATSR